MSPKDFRGLFKRNFPKRLEDITVFNRGLPVGCRLTLKVQILESDNVACRETNFQFSTIDGTLPKNR
jgi:hypothetical protein